MAFVMSSAEEALNEPLESEANTGSGVEAPDEAFLAELGGEFSQTSKPGEDVTEAVADAAEEIVDPEATTEEVEETKEPEKQDEPKGRANKRIQALVKEKKELEGRIAARDQEFQRQMQQVQQQQAIQAQALAQQNAVLQKQLEFMSRREPAPEEDLSKLTPMEQYERQLLSKAEERAMAKLAPRVEAAEKRLAQQEAKERTTLERAKQQATLQKFTEGARVASQEVIMGDVDAEGFDADDNDVAKDLVLAYVAATGVTAPDAAQRFKMWLDKYHQGRLRKVSKTSGKAIQVSRNVPAPIQSGKGTVQGEAKPSWATLKQHGYDNYVQWMHAGAPALRR
jgi:hypothetical protein